MFGMTTRPRHDCLPCLSNLPKAGILLRLVQGCLSRATRLKLLSTITDLKLLSTITRPKLLSTVNSSKVAVNSYLSKAACQWQAVNGKATFQWQVIRRPSRGKSSVVQVVSRPSRPNRQSSESSKSRKVIQGKTTCQWHRKLSMARCQ